MKKNLSKLLILFVLIFVLTGLLSCKEKQKEPEVYKIGAILPMTGNLSFLGELEKNGMILAQEIINKEGGIDGKKIEIVFGDSKGIAKEGVSLANKFININNIKILITSTTGVSFAVEPIATTNKIPLITFCMDPTIQDRSKYIFRLYESMGQEANIILEYFNENKKVKKVAILYVHHAGAEQQYNDYFIPKFKEMGVEVVFGEPYEFSQKDFKNQIVKIKESKADHLIIIGYGFVYPIIFKELKQYDLLGKFTILGGWGFIAPNKTPPELLENVIVAAPKYLFEKNQKAIDFVNVYKNKFGSDPNFDAAFAYDDIIIITEVIKKVGYDPEKIQEQLATIGSFTGVLGKIEISANGDYKVPMGLGIIQNGKIEPYVK